MTTTARTAGERYIERLRDGRTVYLDGEAVASVPDHPAYRNAVRSIARMYDALEDPAMRDLLTFEAPSSGRRVSKGWMLPRSYDELAGKHEAMRAWSELNYGWFGRSPEHVACALGGMVMGLDVFARRDARRAQALADYFNFVRDRDLYVSYVIANPQADRSKAASEQQGNLVAAIVDEDSDGITIRGAKMLGTGAVFSDEILIGNIQPLRPDEADIAFSAALPVATRGLTLLSRRSYEMAAISSFDYPLASHFDENDALVYFDDVRIPWSRVFVHRDPTLCRDQFHATPAQLWMGWQGQVRLTVKMRFLVGLARRIAEANGIIGMPVIAERLGFLAAQASMVEGMVRGMEVAGRHYGEFFIPDRQLLHATHVLTQESYPHFVSAIRELAGGGLIMLPSSQRDFATPEVRGMIEKTQKSPVLDSVGRVRLFKLAWDALGSEFGSRHAQYEMFYSGAQFVTRGNLFRSYPWDDATRLVDEVMHRFQRLP